MRKPRKKPPQPHYFIKRRVTGKVIDTALTGVEAKTRADQLALKTKVRLIVYLKPRRGGCRVYYRTPTAAQTAAAEKVRKEAAVQPKQTWKTALANAETQLQAAQRHILLLRDAIEVYKQKIKAREPWPDSSEILVSEALAPSYMAEVGGTRWAFYSFVEYLTKKEWDKRRQK